MFLQSVLRATGAAALCWPAGCCCLLVEGAEYKQDSCGAQSKDGRKLQTVIQDLLVGTVGPLKHPNMKMEVVRISDPAIAIAFLLQCCGVLGDFSGVATFPPSWCLKASAAIVVSDSIAPLAMSICVRQPVGCVSFCRSDDRGQQGRLEANCNMSLYEWLSLGSRR